MKHPSRLLLAGLATPQEFTASVSLLESGTGQPSELLALVTLFSNPYAARFP